MRCKLRNMSIASALSSGTCKRGSYLLINVSLLSLTASANHLHCDTRMQQLHTAFPTSTPRLCYSCGVEVGKLEIFVGDISRIVKAILGPAPFARCGGERPVSHSLQQDLRQCVGRYPEELPSRMIELTVQFSVFGMHGTVSFPPKPPPAHLPWVASSTG